MKNAEQFIKKNHLTVLLYGIEMADLRTIDGIIEDVGYTVLKLRENNVKYVIFEEMGQTLGLGYQVKIISGAVLEIDIGGKKTMAKLVEKMEIYPGNDKVHFYERPETRLN